MELRDDYKQTETGAIPKDWNSVPLQGRITISHGFGFQSQYFDSHGQYKLTTPGHFHEKGGFRHIGAKQKYFIGPIPKWTVLQRGDLIVAMTEQADGLLGSAAIIPKDDVYLHNQRLGRVNCMSNEIDLTFLFYIFNSNIFRRGVRETAAGTKVKHTSPEKLLNINIPLPPTKTEQTAIANALTDTDAWIQSLTRLIAKKRQIKQGAMQTLLNPYENSRLKAGWVVKKLGEIASFYKGKGLPKSQLTPSGEYECIHYGELFTKYKERICYIESRTNLNESIFISQSNDILMPTSDVTPNGLATASCIIKDGIILGGDILVIRPNNNTLDGVYFSYLINIARDQVMQLVTGSTVYHLYGSDMAKFVLGMPEDTDEQTRIATILSDMDNEITALEAKLAKAQQIKQGMMQYLLTGRIRLI